MQTMTWKILKKSERDIPVPFTLELHEHAQQLHCDKVIRIIPGKRLVAFGVWENKPVVAKLFFEWGSAKKHRERDVNGIDALTAANIPTPKLYFNGTDKSKRIHILIFDRILNSCNLDLLWQEKTDIAELAPLMQAVTIELATQHVMGIVQRDLHLKNFLVTSKTIYTLDGGSIEKSDGILPKKESLEHLALFFSQLGAGTEKLREELFEVYSAARSWIIRPADTALLQQALNTALIQRRVRYQKKILRNCTAFSRIDQLNSLTMYDKDYRSDNFFNLLKNLDVYFAKPDTKILKSGRSSTVARFKLDNRTLVIKRYNIKGLGHWLRRCLRPTRAQTSWKLAHRLRLMGIATAKPIAFIEKTFLGLRSTSYFIMEYVEGHDIGKYYTKYQAEDPRYAQIAKRTLSLFDQLAELRLTHGDLKMSNIIINHDRPVLIDLDGMREHKNTFSFKRVFEKEFKRFIKNWENFPSVKELFLKS